MGMKIEVRKPNRSQNFYWIMKLKLELFGIKKPKLWLSTFWNHEAKVLAFCEAEAASCPCLFPRQNATDDMMWCKELRGYNVEVSFRLFFFITIYLRNVLLFQTAVHCSTIWKKNNAKTFMQVMQLLCPTDCCAPYVKQFSHESANKQVYRRDCFYNLNHWGGR